MEHQNEHEQHGPSLGTLNLIFVVLAVITVGEIAVAEIAGIFGFTLLMIVTSIKAGIVVAYYMHLKYDPPILTWIFVVPMIMGAAVILSLQGLSGY